MDRSTQNPLICKFCGEPIVWTGRVDDDLNLSKHVELQGQRRTVRTRAA